LKEGSLSELEKKITEIMAEATRKENADKEKENKERLENEEMI
jgi:hypothetical protein